MLKLVNEIIGNKTLTRCEKLCQIEKLLNVQYLVSLSDVDLIQLCERIGQYFKYGIPYFDRNKESIPTSIIIFNEAFCNPNIIEKLLQSEKKKSANDFSKFLISLGIHDAVNRSMYSEFETPLLFGFLNYCLTHLPDYEKYAIELVAYLNDEEQINWLHTNIQLITNCIHQGQEKVINQIFENLHQNVLVACYQPEWKSLLSSMNSNSFFKILENNGYLIKNDSIQKSIMKRKKQATLEELQKYLSFYYFDQSNENMTTIYQMIANSTFVSQLSLKEQQVSQLFVKLVESKEAEQLLFLKQLKQLGDYQTILYDICYQLRIQSAKSLVTNCFSVADYPNQKEIVITPDTLKYFFVRTNDRPEPFISKGYDVEAASFSIVSTDNPATYLGNERTIFGFSNIDPNMIAHVYPHDSLSYPRAKYPYYYTNYTPHFIDIKTLMKKAQENNTYPEIVIVKKHYEEETLYPDYILGINEFKKQDLEFAERLNIPKVKILVKDKNKINYKDYYNQ